MIIDTLDHADRYASLLPGLDLAFDFLRSDKPASAELGRYDLDGDRVFAMVQAYTSNPAEQAEVWEAHRQYADVQFIVTGRERMGYASLATMTETQAYDPALDAALYRGDGTLLPFEAGTFAIYLPQDAHMPGVAWDQPSEVRKVVVKVQVCE